MAKSKYAVGLLGGRYLVSWCRKSLVDGKFPFKVSFNRDYIVEIKNPKLIEMSKKNFDSISKTLSRFDFELQELIKKKELQVFFVMAGKNILAIDTQGYDYPRYKSFVESVK